MTNSDQTLLEIINVTRIGCHAALDAKIDELIARLKLSAAQSETLFRAPALVDGHDPRNKNGLNLTERGVEILYRVFDEGGGYNRAAKMLSITQAAAKNRKSLWVKAGGLNRTKRKLDIDG